jgi:pyrroloquinoline quinone biosynthesis protein D
MNDSPKLEERSVPAFVRGVRLHNDEARDQWVLLAPERMLKLDGIAVEILKRVDGESDLGTIVDDLCTAFDAERAQVLNDCGAFLQQLVDRRMVTI